MKKIFCGWLLVLLSTLVLVYLYLGNAPSSQLFMTLVVIAVIMWTAQLSPAFVPGLLVIFVSLLLNIVPQSLLLSGFNSDVFFLVLSVFVLSALLTASGLTYRCVLWLLYRLPDSPWTKPLILFLIGVTLTPIIPSPLGRSAMVTPLLTAMAEKGNQQSVTALAISSIHGSTLFSTIFLTGNPLNFILIGLLDTQIQQRFQWLDWLITAAAAGVVLLIGFLLVIMWQLKGLAQLSTIKDEIKTQLSDLGRLSQKEIGAIVALCAFFVAVIAQPIHQIPLVWASLGIAISCFMLSGLSAKELRTHVDWGTLLFIASIVCWGPAMIHIGMDQKIAEWLGILLSGHTEHLWQLLAILMAFIVVVRLLFPGAPTFVILISSLIPFATVQGINPWLMGFILLTISEGFIFSHQHGVAEQTLSELENNGHSNNINHASILMSNGFMMLVRVAAIFICIPIWHWMAII